MYRGLIPAAGLGTRPQELSTTHHTLNHYPLHPHL